MLYILHFISRTSLSTADIVHTMQPYILTIADVRTYVFRKEGKRKWNLGTLLLLLLFWFGKPNFLEDLAVVAAPTSNRIHGGNINITM